VKHIVEGHRAVVRVESRPGEGARFIVTLPAMSQMQTDGGTP
jgi:signal transduction histidine kinase